MATLGLQPKERQAIEAFRRDVIEPSMTSLVLLDFWAEWCGPCKALSPVLEKVAAAYAARGVVLAKINVDENRLIAEQFRVQTIPTVYAVFQGQIIADLTPARTESQLGQMLDQILRQLPIESAASAQADDIAPLIAMGEQVLGEGDAPRAIGIFSQIVDMMPDAAEAQSGLIRALVAAGDLDGAAAALAALPESLRKDAAIARADAALTLARDMPANADLAALEQRVAADPADFAARYELAGAQMAAGQRDAAADTLIAMIAEDREWNEAAAKTRLLKLFEMTGLEDPWVSAQRRRLSAVLFG